MITLLFEVLGGLLLAFIVLFWVAFAIMTPSRRAGKIIAERRRLLATLPDLEADELAARQSDELTRQSDEQRRHHRQSVMMLEGNYANVIDCTAR